MTSELTVTIHEKLSGFTLPADSAAYFAGRVFKGETNALTVGGEPIVRWHVARTQEPPEGARNLKGERMTTVVFQVHCYWPLTAALEKARAQEDDIAVVILKLPNEFIGLTPADYTIGGYPVAAITVEDISPVERAFPFATSEVEMRILTLEIHARVLEAT